jgi:hypothetical protein
MDKELSPPPPTTAPTSLNTPTTALPPSAGYNTRAGAHNEPDHEILAQLHLTAMDKRKLQIISATIEVEAATPAWSLQNGIIRYNE